jgi:hypothetical protein
MPRGKRPNWRILSVAFETSLQDAGQLRFSIPNEIAQLLGIKKSRKRLRLSIRALSRRVVYDAPKTLTSGKKITGTGMKKSGPFSKATDFKSLASANFANRAARARSVRASWDAGSTKAEN